MRYFLIAGEASGDMHAANLMSALRAIDSGALFAFMGGDKMSAVAQRTPVVHYREVAYMGIGPVLRNLRTIAQKGSVVQEALLRFNPDVVIPVDFGGFNFKYILPFVRKQLPNAYLPYYIPPKVWAWKKWRVNALRKQCSEVLCILPFEEAFLQQHNVRASYIGNPCVDAVDSYWDNYGKPERQEHLRQLLADQSEDSRPIIAILAGSRRQELKSNLPLMLETVRDYYPHLRPVIAGAPALSEEDYRPYLLEQNPVKILFGATYDLLAGAQIALVTSGTATLETALIGTPQVVCYRANGKRVMNWAFQHLFPIRYFSLVNLIADAPLVTELLAADATHTNLKRAIDTLLNNSDTLHKGYQQVRTLLGREHCSQIAAQRIVQCALQNKQKHS